ncbi:MAG: general secretion pathway protein GspF [Thioalkalispiraceae bacterium]|jgi:hypothetical protein
MAKKQKTIDPDAPLLHADHPRPVTRRDFIRQGFIGGGAMVTGSSLLNLFLCPEQAHALSADVVAMDTGPNCVVGAGGALKVPFMCFDLAGGANLAGSNVMVGGAGGQADTSGVSTAGYNRLGLPGDRLPGQVDTNGRGNGDFTDTSLGVTFHSESALLAGMLDKMSIGAQALTNGAIIPARSDNDTGNNPHNPMYGVAMAGARGSLLSLIGSRATESGGNSMAPAMYINPEIRPTKVDRPSDATGLVDTGELLSILNQTDATKVMEAVARISDAKIGGIDPGLSSAAAETSLQQLLRCGYVKAADVAENFADPQALNPGADPLIVNDTSGIFTTAEFNANSRDGSEFRKVASVMKLVVNTLSGAGCVTMGGYDYHTGDRIAGELRDIRAGRCIGAAIEYAHRVGFPLMVYVFSDGSVFSNGNEDNTAVNAGTITLPGGKGQWTGDNSGGASSLIFVYDPRGRTTLRGADAAAQAARQQLGYFRSNGSVETAARTPGGFPIMAANSVTSLVNTVLLNYMALHYDTQSNFAGMVSAFETAFPGHGLGGMSALDELTIFNGMASVNPSTQQILSAQPA